MNDYEMIEKAGNGIARPIEEEGVSFALRHFGYLSADQ